MIRFRHRTNSDGDFQILQWTTGSDGGRFGPIVHHTDAEREYSHDRKSAQPNGRIVVSMKKTIGSACSAFNRGSTAGRIFSR
jgi:hypothetical protein